MRAAGVAAIVVLGGDGTHRAVARECGDVPIAGLSTGTNNAFPQMREPTLTGMAVGLYASGRLPASQALAPNKILEVSINGRGRYRTRRRRISTDATSAPGPLENGEPALLYVAFADPEAIGLSAIAGY